MGTWTYLWNIARNDFEWRARTHGTLKRAISIHAHPECFCARRKNVSKEGRAGGLYSIYSFFAHPEYFKLRREMYRNSAKRARKGERPWQKLCVLFSMNFF
jgi:hypothetical protein